MEQVGGELWTVRVFGSEAAQGQSVALVRPLGAGTLPSLSAVAGDLGHGVTGFLLPGTDGRWTQLAYADTRRLGASPAGLLAAGVAGLGAAFDTPDGVASVELDLRGAAWVRLPTLEATSGSPLAPLASALGRARLSGRAPDVVVRAQARAWLYREVPDPAALQLVDLARERAWSYLRHEGLDAVCLYARQGSGELALRVFSAVRSGGEEAVSPQVLPGLWRCLEPKAGVVVQQGRGAPRSRGTLLLRADGAIGGRVRVLSRGALLQGAWERRVAG